MSGADDRGLVVEMWEMVRSYVPKKKRAKTLKKIIEKFEADDWSCHDEILKREWPESQAAVVATHPNWY
jgi:hypothetical protein